MAPVRVCGTLLDTGACWVYGWLRAAGKTHLQNATFCSFCLDTVRVILTDDLCVRRTWKIKPQKSSSKIFLFFRIDDSEHCWTQNNGTTLQSGNTDCGCRRQATPSLGFSFPLFSLQKRVPYPAFWLFWFCVCGYWLLSPSFGHLTSARSGTRWYMCTTVRAVDIGNCSWCSVSIVRQSKLTKKVFLEVEDTLGPLRSLFQTVHRNQFGLSEIPAPAAPLLDRHRLPTEAGSLRPFSIRYRRPVKAKISIVTRRCRAGKIFVSTSMRLFYRQEDEKTGKKCLARCGGPGLP